MPQDRLTIGRALREHWPEYLMEAWGLGTFMVSAGLFATLLEYPGSPVREAIENAYAGSLTGRIDRDRRRHRTGRLQ